QSGSAGDAILRPFARLAGLQSDTSVDADGDGVLVRASASVRESAEDLQTGVALQFTGEWQADQAPAEELAALSPDAPHEVTVRARQAADAPGPGTLTVTRTIALGETRVTLSDVTELCP